MDKTMEKLLFFNKTGSDLIRKGLEIDEKSGNFEVNLIIKFKIQNLKFKKKENKEGAIDYYKLGMQEFQKGFNIKLEGNQSFFVLIIMKP